MSEFKYTYEHKIVINAPRSEVLEDFLDYENYYEWQPTLKEVILERGEFKQEGHQVALMFEGQGGLMRMNETILTMTLPHKIIIEYTMGPTRNIQYNHFDHFGAKTVWTVQTEFYFESEPPATEAIFKRTTKQGLLAFQKYVESK